MHDAKFNIALAAAARSAGVNAGGPPPGRNLRQACIAAWNCVESGLTLALIVTPAMLTERIDAVEAEPTEAENPCDVKQAARAARLGLDFAVPAPELDGVVPRLATEGVFEPPQPAAATPRSVSTGASTSVWFTHGRKADGSKTALKLL
jgi:hypothetical protein